MLHISPLVNTFVLKSKDRHPVQGTIYNPSASATGQVKNTKQSTLPVG